MQERLTLRRRLAFSAVVALFVLVCIELMLQGFYYATAGEILANRVQPPIFEEDEHRCYRLKPNLAYVHGTNEFKLTIYTNAQGMRTSSARETVPYERRPGVSRVMFLGPSFTFGWGSEFEESYPYLIVEGLRQLGHEVELINLGTPAQGTAHQLCWLASEGRRYQPDLVVQTDYGDIGAFEPTCREDIGCPVIEDGVLYTRRPTPLGRLIAAVKGLGVVFYGYYVYHALQEAPQPGADGTGKELHGAIAQQAAPTPEQAADTYRRYVDHVTGVLGAETDVALVYLPLSYIVHPADAPRWWSRGRVDPEAERGRLVEASAEIRSQGRALLIDPTERLITAGESERMYYWLDIHLTPAGNRVVAEVAIPILDEVLRSRAGGG
jgi:hypothetical protein